MGFLYGTSMAMLENETKESIGGATLRRDLFSSRTVRTFRYGTFQCQIDNEFRKIQNGAFCFPLSVKSGESAK